MAAKFVAKSHFFCSDNCGLWPVDCSQPNDPKIQLKSGGLWYQVAAVSTEADTVSINDTQLEKEVIESRRCESLESFGLDSPCNVANATTPSMVSFFKCKSSLQNITSPPSFHNTSCEDYNIYYTTIITQIADNTSFPSFPQECSFIQLPAKASSTGNGNNPHDFFSLLTANFILKLRINSDCLPCRHQGRQCLFDVEKQYHYCEPNKESRGKIGHVAAIAAICAGLILMVSLCYLILMRKFSSYKLNFSWKKPNQDHQNVEAFLKMYGPLPIRRYNYLDVKQMTNSFTYKIGQGGYGCVYKGKLPNGQLVAVKVLNQSNGNGEEFINEVETITRTSHVNVVALLGFCFQGSKRAMVYEFMSNGSLEKFIFKENNDQNEKNYDQLEWRTLYQIALGIARGLEYLHRGCNTRILHFDIKPHNILLDKDFSPKISDFGLAKVCRREESIISMLDERGTAGYIVPEVICRSFGGISHKSDVYSYGMMVLEMVGGRKNVSVQRSS